MSAIRSLNRLYGCSPDQSCYIGDFAQDMCDAKKAGVQAIGITRGHPTREILLEAGADHVIEHLSELRNLADSSSA
jgi:phosphoglycolate phosphatase-like HAD superfamily hydrolase